MPFYAVLMIIWFALQVVQIAFIGRSVEVTPGGAVITLVINTLTILGVVALAAS